jgi:hypothetical protein
MAKARMYVRRLSPFRWTWEWGLLLAIGFTAFSGLMARVMLGNIDLPSIIEAGDVAEARVLRWHAVDVTLPAMDRFIVAADLEWTDKTGVKRRVQYARVDLDVLESLGGKVHYSNFAPFVSGPLTMQVRYRIREPKSEHPTSDVALLMPTCSPTLNCNVIVLDQAGRARVNSRWRFFYLYDWLVIWLCVGGIAALQTARLAGLVGRKDEAGALSLGS